MMVLKVRQLPEPARQAAGFFESAGRLLFDGFGTAHFELVERPWPHARGSCLELQKDYA